MASTGFDSKIKKAKFAFKDENFCLNGQLNREREALTVKLLEAVRTQENKESGGDRRINTNPVLDAQKAIAAIEARMLDSTVTIRFTAVNNGVWQKNIIQAPPRKGNALDQSMGYNTEKFFNTMIRLTGRFVVEPGTEENDWEDAVLEELTESQWLQFDEAMTSGDWDRIDMTIITLNQRDGARSPDFLTRASRTTLDSETPSELPATSE